MIETAIQDVELMPEAVVTELRQRGRVATKAERRTFLQQVASAWPNITNADLAGYTAQLIDELDRERPTWFALSEGVHRLRRATRFIPSICEVMDTLTALDKEVRNVPVVARPASGGAGARAAGPRSRTGSPASATRARGALRRAAPA